MALLKTKAKAKASPASTPVRPTESGKRKRTNKKKPQQKENEDTIVVREGGTDAASMDAKQVLSAVNAVFKMSKKKGEDGDKLFTSEDSRLSVQVTGIKLPRDNRRQMIRM